MLYFPILLQQHTTKHLLKPLYCPSSHSAHKSLPLISPAKVATIMMEVIYLDGNSLSPDVLVDELGSGKKQIDLTPQAWEKVAKSRAVVDEFLASNTVAYGINTGFGNFA